MSMAEENGLLGVPRHGIGSLLNPRHRPMHWLLGCWADEKVCSFRRTHLRSDFVKRLTFNSGSFHSYPMERTQNQNRSLGNALSIVISCLLFGRETHASTTQSDPLLLPTRNGPCREDGALRWEYLRCQSIPGARSRACPRKASLRAHRQLSDGMIQRSGRLCRFKIGVL